MPIYQFKSLHGTDFFIEGDSPSDAYNNLCNREADNGTLWLLHDIYRNRHAVNNQRFVCLVENDYWNPVYMRVV